MGCSSLSYLEAWFTTTPDNLYTQEWVYGVSDSGKFVKNANAEWSFFYSTYAIPSGWRMYVIDP